MNPRGSVTSSVNSDDDFNNKNINDEKIEDKDYAFPGVSNYNPTSKMSNLKNNTMSSATSGSTKEEDITQDDLQAMKAMIDNMKKDPSLFYKLSSFAAGDGPSSFALGASGDNEPAGRDNNPSHMFLHSNVLAANSAMQNSILVDDDHTEVSSLGMMSYEDSGRSLLNQSHQFSPPGTNQGQSMGARETMQSRTNKDMEIALRMQSLRAKKGLFNSSQVGGGGGLIRSNSTRQQVAPSLLNRSISAPRYPEIQPKLEESKEMKISSKPMSPTPHQNRARSHTSPSVPVGQDYTAKREPNELRKSPGNPKPEENGELAAARSDRRSSTTKEQWQTQPENTPDERINELRNRSDRRPSISRQKCLITPETEEKQQPVFASAANSKESPRALDPDISDQETPNNDEDDGSNNSALVLYEDRYNANDITPRNENRKQFSDSLNHSSINGGYNNTALPFQRKNSDRDMMDNPYFNAVSKYATNDNVRDRNEDQVKRSSSAHRSSSRHKESGRRKPRSDSIHSESNKTRLSEKDEAERRRAKSELRPRIVKQMTEHEGAKKVRTSKRADSLRRMRSVSEDHRKVDSQQSHLPVDIKKEKPLRHSQRQSTVDRRHPPPPPRSRPTFDRKHPPPPPEPKMIDRESSDVMQNDGYYLKKKKVPHGHSDHDEGEEKIDKLSSLHPSYESSFSDFTPKEPGLGEQLQRLNQRDRNYHHEQESSSSRSVISRISHMVKSKATRQPSESIESNNYSMQDVNSSPQSNISPKKSIESDDGSITKSGRTLISRLSHSRLSHSISSPHQSHRRRTTTVENMNSSMTPSDWEKTTIRSANEREAPFMTNEMGDALAMKTELDNVGGEMTRVCDEKGRCIFHPHIRLQKQKLFGGWKIIFKHCPDCAVEHMKKTQKELAEQQLKSRRKKHKEKKDHFINEISEINVGEGHEKKSRKHKKKKNHYSVEHESPREDLQDEPRQPSYNDQHLAPREQQHAENHMSPVDDYPTNNENCCLPLATNEDHQNTRNSSGSKRLSTIPSEYSKTSDDPFTTARSGKDSSDPEPQLQIESEKKESAYKPDQSLAIVEHKPPKTKRVNGLPWSDYNGQSGRYTGEINDEYQPHGRGEMVYDRGVVSSGIWYKGVLDTEGPLAQDEYVPERLSSYSVGDKGREEDMVIAPKKDTAAAVALLRVSDGAFVRRSDGNWTYAVVKDRTDGPDASIKFRVNARGSTKSFPMSQWGSYIRRLKRAADAPAKKGPSLDQFLSNNRSNIGSSHSVAGGGFGSSDHSVGSARSLPMIDRSRAVDNLTTGKMNIRTRSRSRSRNRKNVTTLPLLFSSSMSVSEENEGNDNDGWETASGSGYRLRGIDP